jgi:hypothetical protein
MQAEYYELINCGVKQPFRVVVPLCILFRTYSFSQLEGSGRVLFSYVYSTTDSAAQK